MDKSKHIPKKGGWVMIRQIIPVSLPVDPLSLWYAVPTGKIFVNGELDQRKFMNLDDYELRFGMRTLHVTDWDQYKKILFDFMVNGKTNSFDKKLLKQVVKDIGEENIEFEQQVQIKTLFGDVVIQPHEYTITRELDMYFEALRDGHAFMRHMSEAKNLSGKLADQMFYLRSRGIGYSEALQLVWQNIQTPNQFYIEFHPAYVENFVRDWDRYFFDKIKYVRKQGKEYLLDYGKEWSADEFLSDYKKQEAA